MAHSTGIHFYASDDVTQYSMLPHVPSHEVVIETGNEENQQRHAAKACILELTGCAAAHGTDTAGQSGSRGTACRTICSRPLQWARRASLLVQRCSGSEVAAQ